MPTTWRIVKTKYVDSAFEGLGARQYGSRWASRGHRAIYSAGSLSLATLEILVHLQTTATLSAYSVFRIDLPDKAVDSFASKRLPKDWRAYPAPSKLQKIGDAWLHTGEKLALRLPSVVVAIEHNFLINPEHRDFKKLKVDGPFAWDVDPRVLGKI